MEPQNASTAAPADDFDSVFADITREEGDAKPAAAAPAADTASVPAAGADDATPATDDAAGSAPAAGAAADGADEPDSEAAQLAAAQARIAELEAAAKKPGLETDDAQPEAKKEAPEPKQDDPLAGVEWRKPNEKEGAVLENFRKEWPEVAEAMSTQLQIDIYNTVQYVFAQMKKEYGPRFERLDAVADVVGEMITINDLRSRNSDYDTEHGNVVQWVDSLKGFQKKAAKDVLESGTPEDVTELFAEYRKANPKAPALVAGTDTTPAKAPQAPKGKTELSAAAKKAANALSVVDSKRTSATTTVDPDDFDAAWREATS
jgi:hypothetical protein